MAADGAGCLGEAEARTVQPDPAELGMANPEYPIPGGEVRVAEEVVDSLDGSGGHPDRLKQLHDSLRIPEPRPIVNRVVDLVFIRLASFEGLEARVRDEIFAT